MFVLEAENSYCLVVSAGKTAESGFFILEPGVQPDLGTVEEEKATVGM